MKKLYKFLSIALFGFASLTASAQCGYSIQMDDTFGDGWNGGQLSITIAGTTTIHELLNGSTQTDILSTTAGDSIIVNFLGGSSWNGEISFTLLGTSGSVMYASPLGPVVGIHYAGIACPPNDIGVSVLDLSAIGSCATSTETITIEITNAGSNPQSNFDVNYILNGTAATPENIAGPLAAGAAMMYTFTTTVDVSTAGTYNIDAFTMLSGDQGTGNDTSSVSFVNSGAAPITTFPYSENFDSNADGITGTFANGWYANSSAAFDWTAAIAGTPSTGTGPIGPSGGTGAYMFTEATGSAEFNEAWLYSPCLDLSIATTATLDFTYFMYGAAMGELYIEASLNGTWVVLDSIVGQTHTADTAAWLTKTVDLSSVAGGATTIRFSGVRGAGFTSDIAIDDVSVTLTGFVNVNELSKESFTIYPNPSNGAFSIASSGVNDKVLVNIFDVQGRIVYSSQKQIVPGSVETVSLGNVEKGIYLVNIISSTGKYTQTIIVE